MADHSSEQPYTKTLTSFKDPHAQYHRSANYISWYPEGTGTRKVRPRDTFAQAHGPSQTQSRVGAAAPPCVCGFSPRIAAAAFHFLALFSPRLFRLRLLTR